MKAEKQLDNPNPWTKANSFSRIFFWWLMPLFLKGAKNNLKLSDIYDHPSVDSSERSGELLEREWKKDLESMKNGKQPSLLKAAIRSFGGEFFRFVPLQFIQHCVLNVAQAVLLGYMIQSISELKETFDYRLYIYAAGMCLMAIIRIFTAHPYWFETQRMGMRLRIACCTLIYKKALKLSPAAMKETTIGQMVNLLSNDTNKLDLFVALSPALVTAPLETIICVCVLWNFVGYASIAGVSVLLLYIPVQGMIGKLFSKFRSETAKRTDERIGLMNEIICGIRVIKMYGWEKPFSKLLDLSRRREMRKVRFVAILRGINALTIFVSSKVTLLITLAVFVFVIRGDPIPGKTFFCMALFNTLKVDMGDHFIWAISHVAESLASLKRIEHSPRNCLILMATCGGAPSGWVIVAPNSVEWLQHRGRQHQHRSTSVSYMGFELRPAAWKAQSLTTIPYGATVLWKKFLLLEEKQEVSVREILDPGPKLSECGIWLQEVTASWKKGDEPTLQNVSLFVKAGELLAVVGPVGCGKTSLLMSILGEIPSISGKVKIRGKVAYASQDPWLFRGSIKQNIVFGRHFNSKRYKNVLSVCALNQDIEQFPYGDQTAVGEKGVILSGGQQARVNLARAVYSDADIVLLDDPLSAVDSLVSKHLFEKCVCHYMKCKARILVTHQIHFLKAATRILVLEEGKCMALGTYKQLTELGINFGSLAQNDGKGDRENAVSVSPNESEVNTANESPSVDLSLSLSNELNKGKCVALGTYKQFTELGINFGSLAQNNEKGDRENPVSVSPNESEVNTANECPSVDLSLSLSNELNKDDLKFENKEHTAIEEGKSSGNVKLKTYANYVRAGAGPFLQILIFLSFLITQALFNGSDVWLTMWASQEQIVHNIKDCWAGVNKTLLKEMGNYNDTYGPFNRTIFRITVTNVTDSCFIVTNNYLEDEKDAISRDNANYYMSIYAGLVLALIFMFLVRIVSFFQMCTKSSVTLHNKMFKSILRSPVVFFDINPIGIILNRCSRDLGFIDEVIPAIASNVIEAIFTLFGAICIVSIVEPWLLLPSGILLSAVVVIRRIYLPTARDIKRYEGITRSPVFSHLSTSICGLTTIRAFQAEHPFQVAFDYYQDRHTATWFALISTGNWFGLVLDWVCVFYMITVVSAMVALSHDPLYASQAGLAIATALNLSGKFQYGVYESTELENHMTSVERVIEYSNLKSEANLESDINKKPPKDWPCKGHIIYNNVSLRYSNDEPHVLKNISFEIFPEEKVGIVGRTGAGKTSITASFCRLTEPEGMIQIDGINIKNIGLHDLRKKISIVPQDPVLFTGPIRSNLDPFSEHSDTELWQALADVYIKELIQDLAGGLDAIVLEGGSNFSVGQRQLMCLARAIIRKNRILVLDEATANVDPHTDRLIQKTIRERFANCTLLTIAHRLNTIMDSNRVLILEAGEIKEFDKPHTLLQNSNSLFSLLVQATGPSAEFDLREIALKAYIKDIAAEKKVKLSRSIGHDSIIATETGHRIVNCVKMNMLRNSFKYSDECCETTHL